MLHGIIRFGYFGLKYKYFHKGAEPMESFEPKKLALIRIWQILKEYSDCDHPLTQDDIARHLESDYGIVIERKAISRNISLLKEAGLKLNRDVPVVTSKEEILKIPNSSCLLTAFFAANILLLSNQKI